MVKLSITYVSTNSKEEINLAWERRGTFSAVIKAVNSLSIEDYCEAAPVGFEHPSAIYIKVTNGHKSYNRNFENIVYGCAFDFTPRDMGWFYKD